MRKVIVVAMREYQAAVRSKAFIISLVAMPVFYTAAIGVQFLLKDKVDTSDKRVVVWDRSGQVLDSILDAAQRHNQSEIHKGEGPQRRQVRPRFMIESIDPGDKDPNRVELELADQVREKKLLAYVIVGRDVVQPGSDLEATRVRYHSNSPTYDEIQDWLFGPINDRIHELRLREAKLDREVVTKAIARIPVENLGLVSVDAEGRIREAEKTNEFANFIVPYGLMMLMFMVVMVGASPLVQSVLEEKMGRIAEVLLGSISPFQMMLGKVFGMVGVALTVTTVYLVGAYFGIRQSGYIQFFPTGVIWWFVAYQALAVLMFGSVFAAIGAAVTDAKEAQSVITPVMLVVISPMIVCVNVIREPSSALSTALSFIPPITPMVMVLRQAVPPGIPSWQPALGMLGVLLATIAAIYMGGRIFRVGILMQGRALKMSEMLRWMFRG